MTKTRKIKLLKNYLLTCYYLMAKYRNKLNEVKFVFETVQVQIKCLRRLIKREV